MKIAYFITAHGYGHGVRSCAIINEISSGSEIIIRTALPKNFFCEELHRPFKILPAEFDCGCIQTDSVTVNISETLKCYSKVAENNRKQLSTEVNWCKENRIDLIVSDITPFAFEIASQAGIPSVAISNFTWYDIYSEYLDKSNEFKPLLEEMYWQYTKADVLLALYPSLPMSYFRRTIQIPLVGRKGECEKNIIYEKYCLSKEKRIGLIYVGDFGMHAAEWKKLEKFTDWEFLGLHPIPGNPSNFHLVDKRLISYQNLTASADVVISKIGYGVVAECMLNGTPLIYLPRLNFAEYPVLEYTVRGWGGGFCLTTDNFHNLVWDDALKSALAKGRLPKISSDGAQKCAFEIQKMV